MKVLITHKAVIEMSQAAFEKFQKDPGELIHMLYDSDVGVSEVRIAGSYDGPKHDDWDDEYCEVDEPERNETDNEKDEAL